MILKRSFAIVVAAVLVAGCGAESETSDGKQIVNIGHVGPLTGPISHLGKDNERGAGLAFDEANELDLVIDGVPVQFRLLSEDDEANPQKATVVAQKLVDSNIVGLV